MEAFPPQALADSNVCVPDSEQLSSNLADPPIVTSASREVASGAVRRRTFTLLREEEKPERSTKTELRVPEA